MLIKLNAIKRGLGVSGENARRLLLVVTMPMVLVSMSACEKVIEVFDTVVEECVDLIVQCLPADILANLQSLNKGLTDPSVPFASLHTQLASLGGNADVVSAVKRATGQDFNTAIANPANRAILAGLVAGALATAGIDCATVKNDPQCP